jgi:hypothetical protein
MKELFHMRKVLVTIVLALTAGALAQGTTQQPSAQKPADIPTSQKVIKNPAEYNAYITALNMTDPAAKARAMETFVQQYPDSIVKIEALEQAMAAYQQLKDAAKVEATAKRILQLRPNNVRALAIVTFIDRSAVTSGQANKLQDMCSEANKGIAAVPAWEKPADMKDDEFAKLKTQMTGIFEGTAGFCDLQQKNYAGAIEHYEKSGAVGANNMGDIYQLGIAELESNPINKNGFWHIAKAYSLAPTQAAKDAINNYGRSKYVNYHGNADGWDAILAAAATQKAPGPEIAAITPKPTPAELACKAVQDNDPAELSFADWEYILQFRDVAPCNKEAADKVWAAIQNKQKDSKGQQAKLKLNVKVISTTPESVDAAMTEDNQKENKADLHVVLDKPVAKPPAAGSMIDVIGVISDYTPDPFMFTMTKAELPSAKPPAKKKTTPRRRSGGTARRHKK